MDDGLPAQRSRSDRPKSHALLDRGEVRRDLTISRALGISLRDFDRLPPLERDLRIAEWYEEQTTCGECGHPMTECSDPTKRWYPYRVICYLTMAKRAASDDYVALHEKAEYHDGTFQSWSAKRTRSHPFHRDAGVTIGVAETDLHPWDNFTHQVDASPVRPPAGRSTHPPDAAESSAADDESW